MTPLRVVPDPAATWDEACAAAMFRSIHRDIRAAAQWIALGRAGWPGEDTSRLDAETDSVIGLTLAALAEAGWLAIPDRPERTEP